MAEDRRMTASQVVDKVMTAEHADVLRESVAWLVTELMESEVAAQISEWPPALAPERTLDLAPLQAAAPGPLRAAVLTHGKAERFIKKARRAHEQRVRCLHLGGYRFGMVPRPPPVQARICATASTPATLSGAGVAVC